MRVKSGQTNLKRIDSESNSILVLNSESIQLDSKSTEATRSNAAPGCTGRWSEQGQRDRQPDSEGCRQCSDSESARTAGHGQ